MESLEDEYHLVQALEAAEKRHISLLGRATAGGDGGQVMQLFDFLKAQKTFDAAAFAEAPPLLALGANLPTLARRLRQLIFKALQHLEAGRSIDGRIDLLQTEVGFLHARRQFGAALKAARRGQQFALRYGRPSAALPFIDWQRRLLLESFPAEAPQQLTALHTQAQAALALAARQETLRHFQQVLLVQRRQALAPRSSELQALYAQIADAPEVQADAPFPDLLTESLTRDVQGLLALAQKRGEDALQAYTLLLARWQAAPDWIRSHSERYLELFKHYQIAIFWGTVDSARLQSYLDQLPALDALPPKSRLDFARIQHGHLLTLGLNTGNFELVLSQVPRILAWLKAHATELPAATQLAFHYNICVAFFLNGDFRAAYQQLKPILNFPQRNAREDILEFARVLQAILLYQLGDHDLSEYLGRSARQFFKRNPRQWAFEEAVLRYLGILIAQPQNTHAAASTQLAGQLAQFAAESSRPYPLLGLAEVRCWLAFRMGEGGIREVFLGMLG